MLNYSSAQLFINGWKITTTADVISYKLTLKHLVWINEQDTKDMDQIAIDDMIALMRGVAEHYHNTYGETDKNFKVIETEMEFLVKLDEDLFMTGTIDLIYEVDGKIQIYGS
jgi:hypothetical protein